MGYLLRDVRPLGATAVDVLIADGIIADMGAGLDVGDATVVEGAGQVLLPGLVDLHAPARTRREDAETVRSGSAAAALGGFTAVHAMANTDPSLTRRALWSRCSGWASRPDTSMCTRRCRHGGPGRRAVGGVGAMADSAARCGSSATTAGVSTTPCSCAGRWVRQGVRRVIAQHARSPADRRSPDERGCGVRGPRAARLACRRRRGHHRPRHPARRSRRLAAARVSRLDGGQCRPDPPGQERGIAVTAETTPHHLLLTDELARVTTRCTRSTRRCGPAATSRRCWPGWPTAPWTSWRPTMPRTAEDKDCEWDVAAFGMLGLPTALSVVIDTLVRPGLLDWAGVARNGCPSHRPPSVGWRTTVVRSRSVNRRTSRSWTRGAMDRQARPFPGPSRNSPYRGMELPGQVTATFLRGTPPCWRVPAM